MWEYTVAVDGMMCPMCEAHTNDAVRNNFKVKKVTSSHSKNQTVIIAEEEIDEEKLKKVITELGYTVGEIKKAPYKKKGLFGR